MCVSCQPIYRSLPCSILFLNFLYKRLREGKRRVSEQGADGRRKKKKSAIMDFILNPLPISQTNISPKKRHSVQITHIFKPQHENRSFTLQNTIWQHAFCTHTATALHATLAMLLSELVDTGGDVRTTKRDCSKHCSKRWRKYNVYKALNSLWMRFCAHHR